MARAWYWSSRWLPTAGSTRCGSSCCSPAPTTRTGSCAAWWTARRAPRSRTRATSSAPSARCNLFFEQDFQEWALSDARWIVDGANWMYVNSHFVLTVGFLIWLYLARNEAYYFVRNMFMVAMGIALVGYVVYPTAPPRFMPEWGFQDTVTEWVGLQAANNANALYNPFAADTEHARGVRADDRRAGALCDPQPRDPSFLRRLSIARHRDRRGDRQPLVVRRVPRARSWPACPRSPRAARSRGPGRTPGRSGPASARHPFEHDRAAHANRRARRRDARRSRATA